MFKDYYNTPFSLPELEDEKLTYYNSLVPLIERIGREYGSKMEISMDQETTRFFEDGWRILDSEKTFYGVDGPENTNKNVFIHHKDFYGGLSLFLVHPDGGIVATADFNVILAPGKKNRKDVKVSGIRIVEVYTGKIYGVGHVLGKQVILPKVNGKGFPEAAELRVVDKRFKNNFYDGHRIDRIFDELFFNCIPERYLKSYREMFDLSNYMKIVSYFGNRTESLLRQDSPWLLQVLGNSMNFSKPLPNKIKNLKQFFGVNQQELNYFLSQKDERRLTFYLIVKKYGDYSVAQAMKMFDKVEKICEKYELDKEYRWSSVISVKGPRGKNIFKTTKLPRILNFYIERKLYNQISLPKYIRYLIDEKKKNPEVMLHTLEGELYDFNKMAREIIGTTDFVLPYNIVNAHTTMVMNYNTVKKEKGEMLDTENNIKKLNSRYNDEIYSFEDDEFLVRRPIVPSDLHKEGMILNHCVGTYTQRVIDGRTKIFFIRKKDNPDKPLVTVEVANDGRIIQERGKGNRKPTLEEHNFIMRWSLSYTQKKKEMKNKASSINNVDREYISSILAKQEKKREEAQQYLTNLNFANEQNAKTL